MRAFLAICTIASVVACGVDNSATEQSISVSAQEGSAAALVRPHLTSETKQRICKAFTELESSGRLNGEDVWHLRTVAPADLDYARFVLRDDADRGIMDGFAHIALIPAGHVGTGDSDPNKAALFYLQRIGGFAGSSFYAGPFTLTDAGLVLADFDSAIEVSKGEPLAIQLSANPSTGYSWKVDSDPQLPAPSEEFLPRLPVMPGSPGVERFEWDTSDGAFVAGQTYTLTFRYARSDDEAVRTVVVTVNVTP